PGHGLARPSELGAASGRRTNVGVRHGDMGNFTDAPRRPAAHPGRTVWQHRRADMPRETAMRRVLRALVCAFTVVLVVVGLCFRWLALRPSGSLRSRAAARLR